METKSASRSVKKSGLGCSGSTGDRRKSKGKKKKEKRKQWLKGAESTDVPSPDVDSEAPVETDTNLTDQGDNQFSQGLRLPHLDLQSSVSLTTQVHGDFPPDLSMSMTSGNIPQGPGTSAADVGNIEGVVARTANLNIKQRSSKPRSKGHSSKSKSSRTKERQSTSTLATFLSSTRACSNSLPHSQGSVAGSTDPASNESLRWENIVDDTDKERERIADYKMNRRKRYLAAAQAKGLRWASNSKLLTAESPVSEDSGVEVACAPSSVTSYIDYGMAKTVPICVVPMHRGLHQAVIET